MAEFGPPLPITRDELIDVLRRNFEAHWIGDDDPAFPSGLLGDPSSLSIFEGAIAQILRIQESVDENLYNGAFILTAPGRSPATSTVRLSRPSGAEVVVLTTTRFQDDRGAIWRPISNFTIPASGGAQEVDVPIQTERAGYFLNSFLPLTYQALDPLPDPTLITIAGVDPAVGGKTPYLDQHGKERRVFRASLESDEQYRARIRFIEDQVSPKAIAQTVIDILDAFPLTKPIVDLIIRDGLRTVIEPFEDSAQHAQINLTGSPGGLFYDSEVPIPVPAITPYIGGAFLDDLNGGVLRSREDACAWFDIFLPNLVDPDEARRFTDDPDPLLGFWFDDDDFGYMDGVASEALTAPIAALADELDRRRAACVRFRIIVGEDVRLVRVPPFGSLRIFGAWSDQSGATTEPEIIDAVATFDGDETYMVTTTGAGPSAAFTASDLLFDMPTVTPPVSISHVVMRARVRKQDVGAGADPIFNFVIGPTAVAPERVPPSVTIDTESYREIEVILEENPIAAAPWTLGDISGIVIFGCANTAGVATEELRVSELSIEFVVNHG